MSIALNPGDIINERYAVQSEHPTENPMLRYYIASDLLLGRTVMVKISNVVDNSHFMARFAQEAHVLASLEHPHIVPIHDFGLFRQHPYQVQRFLTGGKLGDYIAEHPGGLPASAILMLAQQMSSALDYIHDQGILHRNITTKDIVLDEQKQPYLTNFELAMLRENTQEMPQADETQDGDFSRALDLYAFGLVLFQMMTGKMPLMQYNQFNDSVREHRPDLPLGVDLVIDRLMRSDREARFDSASAAVTSLQRAFYSGQSDIAGRVFVSYARSDSEYVVRLVTELRRIGLGVWMDRDIPPGANWDQTIEQALNTCDKMLLIASPASMLSENVQDEWSFFLEHGKAVYPFMHQDCELSFRLRRRQYIPSTGDLLGDVARIVDVLAGGNPLKFGSVPDATYEG